MLAMRFLATLLALSALALPAQEPVPWIVDTDGGTDDYLAIAYLLAKPNVRVEAIASVNGISSAAGGAKIAARILQLARRDGVPVFIGAGQPLTGNAAFPLEWRKMGEELTGVDLPKLTRKIEAQSAESYYLTRLTKPARILALGPLTNLAAVLRKNPALARNVQELVIMGGAVSVPGNLKDGGFLKTSNTTAEWNIFIDPEAAGLVFRTVPTIKLVPLDATNRVPILMRHLSDFERGALHAALGRLAYQILKLDEPFIKDGYYYAWDPLAAMAAAMPRLFHFNPAAVTVSRKPGEEGRTKPMPGRRPNLTVLDPPRPADFHTEFYNAFATLKKIR